MLATTDEVLANWTRTFYIIQDGLKTQTESSDKTPTNGDVSKKDDNADNNVICHVVS